MRVAAADAMRRGVAGGMSAAVVLGLLAAARAAGGVPPAALYLREGLALLTAAPTATLPRDDVEAWIGAGQRIVLAEFLSEPAAEVLTAEAATVALFLATGRTGMDGCADVLVEVARRGPGDERVVRGAALVSGSILPRRDTVEPIAIPLVLEQPLALPGDRIAVAVGVENRCDDARGPVLLYDALGFASAVHFAVPPPTSTTTTSSTSTTSTSVSAPPAATTTTITPSAPPDCTFFPLAGWEAAWCRLDALAAVLADEPPDVLGGAVTVERLRRRLARTRGLVQAAEAGARPRRHVRRARTQLAAMARMLRAGQRRGRVEADVAAEVADLAAGAAGALARVL